MPRIEYRLKTFPELVMLKLQAKGPGLLEGKSGSGIRPSSTTLESASIHWECALTMLGIIIIAAGVALVIAMTVVIVRQRQRFPYPTPTWAGGGSICNKVTYSQMLLTEDNGAGDGIRTRDSLLGRQELFR